MKIRVILSCLALISTLSHPPVTAHAQGTAFTYQGRLNDGVNQASGFYDLRFTIHDSASSGTQQGNALTNAATAISNGLFTVTLDFGDQFPGAGRWLEIGVRTTGGGAFATLSPRQPLTPTPYALRAANATTANSAGSVAAANITGTIPLAQLPPTIVTNGASGVNFTGTFSGNAGGLSNLNSVNLTGPLSISFGDPVLIGQAYTGEYTPDAQALGVAVSGNYAYLANETDGLQVYDISNPANPLNIGHTNNGGSAWGVAVSGNYAYLANDTDGLRVYDIGIPATPVSIGHINSGGSTRGLSVVAVAGNYAYLPNDRGGFGVYDISNPANPVNSGHIRNGGGAEGVAVAGNYAYLANGYDGLQVYALGVVKADGFRGDGSGLTGLNASQLTSGRVPDAQLSADVAWRSGGNTFSGEQSFTDAVSVGSGITSATGNSQFNFNAGSSDVTMTLRQRSAADSVILAVQDILTINRLLVTTNGISVVGNTESTGTTTAAAVVGNGAGLTSLDAGNIASGTIADARLSANVPLLSGGELSDSVLSANVARRSGGNTFSGAQSFTDAVSVGSGITSATGNSQFNFNGGYNDVTMTLRQRDGDNIMLVVQDTLGFNRLLVTTNGISVVGNIVSTGTTTAAAVVGNGAGLTSLDAGNIASGTIADARLSANVALRSGGNTFTGDQIITGGALYNYGGQIVRPTNPGWAAVTEWDDTNNTSGVRAMVGADGVGITGTANQMFVGTYSPHPIAFYINAARRMIIDTNGNVGIGIDAPQQKLHVNGNILANGSISGTVFNPTSDRNAKENFASVSPLAVLDKVMALPISQWNFKTDTGATHIGPMAQDFYAAFGTGNDDKHIATVDADGVALAAIQGLNQKLELTRTELRRRDAENAALQARLEKLEQLVEHRLNGGAK